METSACEASSIVYDGTAALTMFDEFRPEIVLLDIGLPGLSGFDLHLTKPLDESAVRTALQLPENGTVH